MRLFLKQMTHFAKNLWHFRKDLWTFRPWDYQHNLDLFASSIKRTADYIETQGNEVDESRIPKVEKMRRMIELISRIRTEYYADQAEQELGPFTWKGRFEPTDKPGVSRLVFDHSEEEQQRNRRILHRTRELEEAAWNELWQILKGNEHDKGSDARGWWD